MYVRELQGNFVDFKVYIVIRNNMAEGGSDDDDTTSHIQGRRREIPWYKKGGVYVPQRGRGAKKSSSGRTIPSRTRGNGRSRTETVAPGKGITNNRSIIDFLIPIPKYTRIENPISAAIDEVQNSWRTLLPGFEFYYPDAPPDITDAEIKFHAILKYLRSTQLREKAVDCVKTRGDGYNGEIAYFSLTLDEACNNDEFMSVWPEIAEELSDNPQEVLTLWSAAVHKVLQESTHTDETKIMRIEMGMFKSTPIVLIGEVRSEHIGKFVTVKGSIVSIGPERSYCKRMTFQCKECKGEFTVAQPDGILTNPEICKASVKCKSRKKFEPLPASLSTLMVQCKRIRVQDTHRSSGEDHAKNVPKIIECIVYGDWMDMCETGDIITLSGIVKVSRQQRSFITHTYIDVSAIQLKNDSGEMIIGGNYLKFTEEDNDEIRAIREQPHLFRLLVASFCPAIYGHELVKAGILLSMFGGTLHNGGILNRRSDINVLIVGDPGMGKSIMLKRIVDVAPKAVYVCGGTGCSVAGLTVTLVRDGNDYTLEAGAMILGHNGIALIDEFDKMRANHHALLEAMEQQSVSIAKCGIHRSIPARTTVIAAANPVDGHYDECKTVAENLKMNPPILSRFDLIFILIDRPDGNFDKGLIAHKTSFRKAVNKSNGSSEGSSDEIPANSVSSNQHKLIDRITFPENEVLEEIPTMLIQKYIAYARRYVHPIITPEAKTVLKKFYLSLRKEGSSTSTPVTPRQFESVVRLAEARAKIDLRESVSVEDASDAIEIFEFGLRSVNNDKAPMPATRSTNKRKKTISQADQLLEKLDDIGYTYFKKTFSLDEIVLCARDAGFEDGCHAIIEALVKNGSLIHKEGRLYDLAKSHIT